MGLVLVVFVDSFEVVVIVVDVVGGIVGVGGQYQQYCIGVEVVLDILDYGWDVQFVKWVVQQYFVVYLVVIYDDIEVVFYVDEELVVGFVCMFVVYFVVGYVVDEEEVLWYEWQLGVVLVDGQ